MAARDMTIGPLARRTGCKVQTIRYYEEIGLMPPAPRTAGNHRVYSSRHVERLSFVRHGRELGFSLDRIRELLALGDDPGRSCEEVDHIARTHLDDVERKIARLRSLRAELKRMISACGGGRVGDCRIIEVLADHSHAKCLADNHEGSIPSRTGGAR